MGKYLVKKSSNSQFYWVFNASNGEPIMKSEMYSTKQGCLNGVASSKKSVDDRNFQRMTSVNAKYYFNQLANNYQVLGTSEMYNSSQGCENGIFVVKREAPSAQIEDQT
jgi:uncharacterized protein YegP (UPF0339 family)